jgi:hypothetical protein
MAHLSSKYSRRVLKYGVTHSELKRGWCIAFMCLSKETSRCGLFYFMSLPTSRRPVGGSFGNGGMKPLA